MLYRSGFDKHRKLHLLEETLKKKIQIVLVTLNSLISNYQNRLILLSR